MEERKLTPDCASLSEQQRDHPPVHGLPAAINSPKHLSDLTDHSCLRALETILIKLDQVVYTAVGNIVLIAQLVQIKNNKYQG